MNSTMTEPEFRNRLYVKLKESYLFLEEEFPYPPNSFYFFNNRMPPKLREVADKLKHALCMLFSSHERWKTIVEVLDVVDSELKTIELDSLKLRESEKKMIEKLREIGIEYKETENTFPKQIKVYKKIVEMFDFARNNPIASSLSLKG